MAYHVELQIAAGTDTGLIRAHNEDSIEFSAQLGLAVLADGMGGYNAGEVASSIATAIVRESIEGRLLTYDWNARSNRSAYIQQIVLESIEHANLAIYESARNEPEFAGMGTTLVVALFHQDRVAVAHVGDSRIYRLRNGVLDQITRDHSLLQEQIDAGLVNPEWARFSPNKNLVTRAVGVNDSVAVEFHEHATEAGDLYLICSDGLSDMLAPEDITECLIAPEIDLQGRTDALIRRANANGGRDNISIILIQVLAVDGGSKGFLGQILRLMK